MQSIQFLYKQNLQISKEHQKMARMNGGVFATEKLKSVSDV